MTIELLSVSFIIIIFIVFFSSVVQGISGFGFALVAVPLLAIIMPHQMAVPVVSLSSLIAAIIVVLQNRKHCNWKSILWLGIPALIISPLGVHLLSVLTAKQLQLMLGIILIYDTIIYFRKKFKPNQTNSSKLINKIPKNFISIFIGGFSGILGGALGMTGPLLANYLIKTGIKREEFKTTLNMIFFFSATWRIILYFIQNVMTGETFQIGLLILPFTFIGILTGTFIGKRISNKSFVLFVHIFIGLIGIWQIILGLK